MNNLDGVEMNGGSFEPSQLRYILTEMRRVLSPKKQMGLQLFSNYVVHLFQHFDIVDWITWKTTNIEDSSLYDFYFWTCPVFNYEDFTEFENCSTFHRLSQKVSY